MYTYYYDYTIQPMGLPCGIVNEDSMTILFPMLNQYRIPSHRYHTIKPNVQKKMVSCYTRQNPVLGDVLYITFWQIVQLNTTSIYLGNIHPSCNC